MIPAAPPATTLSDTLSDTLAATDPTPRPNLVLVVVAGALVAAGVYLVLERSLSRVLLGLLLAGNGINVMFLVASGEAAGAPIIGANDPDDMSDPLPQAMVLTAIVITLGMAGFLLAMAYRSWRLTGADDVQDDPEDAAIRRLADEDVVSQSYDEDTGELPDETPIRIAQRRTRERDRRRRRR